MLLAVDIGNTNTVVGAFDRDKLVTSFRVASVDNLTPDEAGLFLTGLLEKMKIAPADVTRVVLRVPLEMIDFQQ